MSNIVVDYDLIENALPTIGDLSKGCESLNTNVDTTTSDLESLGGKHDDCFGSSIGVLDMFSGFIKKIGSEYEAVSAVANTALSTFKNTEGKITADTDKIADLKWLLVYLGMDPEKCNDLDFDNVNSDKPDISKYAAYYKDTNADLSSSVNSEIADMLLIEDGKGGYRVLTRSEIEEYIKEMSKAETSKSAETTYSNNSGDYTGARSSNSTSSSSSGIKSDDKKSDGTLEERKEDEKTEDNPKTDEEKPTEETPKTDEDKPTEETPKTDEENGPVEEPSDTHVEQVPGDATVPQPSVPTAEVGTPQVPAQPVGVAPSNVSNIGIENITPEVGSTVVPDGETPAEPTTPETPTIPSTEPTTPSSGTRHNTTIPSTTPSSSTTNNGSSPAKFVFPALGAIAAAGAAGVGAKMYLDKKNGEEEYDDSEVEDYNEYETDDVNDSMEEEYNPNSSIQAPDSSWSLDNNNEENRY